MFVYFQLLFGLPDSEMGHMKLLRDPMLYHYLNQGGSAKVRDYKMNIISRD